MESDQASLIKTGWTVGIILLAISFIFAVFSASWLLYARHKRKQQLKAFGQKRNHDLIYQIASRSRISQEDKTAKPDAFDKLKQELENEANKDKEIIDEINLYLFKSKSRDSRDVKSNTFPITPQQDAIPVTPLGYPAYNETNNDKLGSPTVYIHEASSIGNISNSTKSFNNEDGEEKFNANWKIDSKETRNPDEMLAEFNQNRLNWMMHMKAQRTATNQHNRTATAEANMIIPSPPNQPILAPQVVSPLPGKQLSRHKSSQNQQISPWNMIHTNFANLQCEPGPNQGNSPKIELMTNAKKSINENKQNNDGVISRMPSAISNGSGNMNINASRARANAYHSRNHISDAQSRISLGQQFNINIPNGIGFPSPPFQFLPPPAYKSPPIISGIADGMNQTSLPKPPNRSNLAQPRAFRAKSTPKQYQKIQEPDLRNRAKSMRVYVTNDDREDEKRDELPSIPDVATNDRSKDVGDIVGKSNGYLQPIGNRNRKGSNDSKLSEITASSLNSHLTRDEESDTGESDDADKLSTISSSSGNASELFMKVPAENKKIRYELPKNEMKDDYKISMFDNLRGLPPANPDMMELKDNGDDNEDGDVMNGVTMNIVDNDGNIVEEEEAEFMNEITMNEFDHQRNGFILMNDNDNGHDEKEKAKKEDIGINPAQQSLDTAMESISQKYLRESEFDFEREFLNQIAINQDNEHRLLNNVESKDEEEEFDLEHEFLNGITMKQEKDVMVPQFIGNENNSNKSKSITPVHEMEEIKETEMIMLSPISQMEENPLKEMLGDDNNDNFNDNNIGGIGGGDFTTDELDKFLGALHHEKDIGNDENDHEEDDDDDDDDFVQSSMDLKSTKL